MLVLELGRKAQVDHLAFSPDGRALAAAGDFGVALWPGLEAGRRADWVAGPRWVWGPRFTADGRWLFCTSGGDLARIDPRTGEWSFAPRLWPPDSYTFALSPTDPLILTARPAAPSRPARLLLWRTDVPLADGQVWARTFDDDPAFRNVPFFVPGGQFARAETSWNAGDFAHRVRFYDAATGDPAGDPVEAAHSGVVTPDGRWLAGLSANRLDLTALADGAASHIRNDSRRYFTGVAFHPGGRLVALTSNDHTVKLYDTATWELARTFTWKVGRMRSIAFSPDGTLAAAGSDKGQVVVWDVDV